MAVAAGPPGRFAPGDGPTPSVAVIGWLQPFVEPVRGSRALRTSLQQVLAYQENPTTVTPFAWFEPLAEPVQKKPTAPPQMQAFTVLHPNPVVSFSWFNWLDEPVRIKPGLKASLQQFLASPSRLLPTPTSFGVLDALETKDTFLAGAMIWNRAANTEIGVINTTSQPAEIGLYQTAPTAGTITVRISIIIG